MLGDGGVPSESPVRTRVRASVLARPGCIVLVLAAACARTEPTGRGSAAAGALNSAASPPVPAPEAAPADESAAQGAARAARAAESCPSGMAWLPGGDFWVGSEPSERRSADESPRFLTRLAPYCLDFTEVTVAAYASCVAVGACAPAGTAAPELRLCNAGKRSRGDHPINCVRFEDAARFCANRQARLPTEIEWEYAARGGAAALQYPWGEGSPDSKACWKHAGTCKVATFPAGAFGLFDIVGNVWEWTSTWYGPYPFPPAHAYARVYRGGSFSRRFEKWMQPRLRNRASPRDLGSHLGFRCAATPPGAPCPFGSDPAGSCLHGVIGRECPSGEAWNGVRCAGPGEPRCKDGRVERAGFGCVVEQAAFEPASSAPPDLSEVTRVRTPEHDTDCAANQPSRPRAYRYERGTHRARNAASQNAGCKNRDVGVGWNSTCCR